MVGTEHRTHPDEERKLVQERTPKGAASWSTGPHRCRECAHWWGSKAKAMQDEQPCQKFRRLTPNRGKSELKIYGGTLSCRYFEQRSDTKPLTTPKPAVQPDPRSFWIGPSDEDIAF